MTGLIAILCLGALTRDECVSAYPHRVPQSARAYQYAFDPIFVAVGLERGVEPALLKAIAYRETRFDPCAVSPVGARGMMQFMPRTFEWMGAVIGSEDPFDPSDAIRSAGLYLAALINYWRGDLQAVIASYNAGPSAVARARRRGLVIPAIAETEGYVSCVLQARGNFTGPMPTSRARVGFFGRLKNVFEAAR